MAILVSTKILRTFQTNLHVVLQDVLSLRSHRPQSSQGQHCVRGTAKFIRLMRLGIPVFTSISPSNHR